MCEEGAVKKMQVPINSALQQSPPTLSPQSWALTWFSLGLKKGLKGTSLFVEVAEDKT